MPLITLTPGDWTPDAGNIGHSGLYKVNDAIPIGGGWASFPTAVSETVAVAVAPSELYGLHIHETTASNLATWRLFGATETRLLRGTNNADLTLTSADATVHTACTAGVGWQFTSFGDQVWCTSGTNEIQYASTPTTDFIDGVDASGSSLTSYQPWAKYITTVKNHILIGNITHKRTVGAFTNGDEKPSMVMWSATDNGTRYGDEDLMLSYAGTDSPASILVGSGWHNLSDNHGPITGLIGGDYALIFKSSAIYRMDGPPWTFHPISEGVGTIHHKSIVRYGDDVYFYSSAGPMVIRGGSSQPQPLGRGRVTKTLSFGSAFDDTNMSNGDMREYFFNSYSTTDTRVWGAVDLVNGLIIWGQDASNENTMMLVYNVEEDRFGFAGGDSNVSSGVSSYPASASGPIISLAAFSPVLFFKQPNVTSGGTQDAPTPSLFNGIIFSDTRQYSADFVRLLVAQDCATDTLYPYRWSPQPYFEWPFLPFYSENDKVRATRIARVRPVYDCAVYAGNTLARTTKSLKCVVTVKTQSRFPENYHQTQETYDPYVDTYQDNDGWIDISSSVFGTHHSIAVQFFHPSGSGLTYDTPLTALTRSLFHLEVEYDTDGSSYGSPYRT